MKITLLAIAFNVISILNVTGQPTIQWQVSLGGSGIDELDQQGNNIFNNLILTNDDGFAFAGTSYSNDGDVTGHHGLITTSDIWFGKLDGTGNLQWQKSLGGTGDERAKGLCQTSDGGYMIIGESWSDDGDVGGHHGSVDTMDAWVVKLDDQGNIQWQNSYGGTAMDYGVDVKQTPEGGYIIGADSRSSNGDVSINKGFLDFWFVKIDSLGVIQWEKSFGGSSGDRLRSFQLTNDGGIIAIGSTSSNDGDITFNANTFLSSIWVLKLDSIGNKEWDKCFGSPGLVLNINEGNDIYPTLDGGYILNSHTSAFAGSTTCSSGGFEAWVAKLDSMGNIDWVNCYGGLGTEFGKTIRPTQDGGFLVAATTDSASVMVTNHIGETDCWIVKTDSLGNIEWEGTYGGTNYEGLTTAIQTPDGGYILGAESLSNDIDVSGHHGSLSESDIWIVKLASLPTAINELPGNISSFTLSPNPVTDIAYMKYELSEKSHALIELMDISGRVVYKLTDKNMPAGVHEQKLNLQNLSFEQGMYLLRLNTGNSIMTLKLIKN